MQCLPFPPESDICAVHALNYASPVRSLPCMRTSLYDIEWCAGSPARNRHYAPIKSWERVDMTMAGRHFRVSAACTLDQAENLDPCSQQVAQRPCKIEIDRASARRMHPRRPQHELSMLPLPL